MADFCNQCGEKLGIPPTLAGLLRDDEVKDGLVLQVICEGCGPTYVDNDGTCVDSSCLSSHKLNDGIYETNLADADRQPKDAPESFYVENGKVKKLLPNDTEDKHDNTYDEYGHKFTAEDLEQYLADLEAEDDEHENEDDSTSWEDGVDPME